MSSHQVLIHCWLWGLHTCVLIAVCALLFSPKPLPWSQTTWKYVCTNILDTYSIPCFCVIATLCLLLILISYFLLYLISVVVFLPLLSGQRSTRLTFFLFNFLKDQLIMPVVYTFLKWHYRHIYLDIPEYFTKAPLKIIQRKMPLIAYLLCLFMRKIEQTFVFTNKEVAFLTIPKCSIKSHVYK